MTPNPDAEMHTISDPNAEGVPHGSLQGTFHGLEVPTGSMSMTSYVSPNSQAFPNYAIGSPALWVDAAAPEAVKFPYMIDQSGQRWPVAQYTDCKADSGIDQINGVVIVCDAGMTDDDLKPPKGKYFYQGCKKLGSGAQVNGVEVVYHGGSPVPTAPGMPGRWDKMDMLNAEGKEIKGMPKNQINGSRVRLMKRADMGSTSNSA